jgi:hypothetical protein
MKKTIDAGEGSAAIVRAPTNRSDSGSVFARGSHANARAATTRTAASLVGSPTARGRRVAWSYDELADRVRTFCARASVWMGSGAVCVDGFIVIRP